MRSQAYLCPCCAAHLQVDAGFTTLRCDNCASPLVFTQRGGVSGLLLLPDAGTVPYSDPRSLPRALDGVALARSAWSELLIAKLRKRGRYGAVFAVFAILTALTALYTLTSLRVVAGADRREVESATFALLLGMAAIPVTGFIAAFFWDRFMAAHHEVGSVLRRLCH